MTKSYRCTVHSDIQAGCYSRTIAYSRTHDTSAIFFRQGLVPCSPDRPSVAITTRTLETFRILHLRCPRLAIQPFAKSLCDIHGVAFRPYLSTQFSIAYDLYLAALALIRRRVQTALGRNTPNWRLANACAPCLYKLEGEKALGIEVLACMDGNNSQKRIARRANAVDEEGELVRGGGGSTERIDTRIAGGDYFLSRAEVDEWDKEVVKERMQLERVQLEVAGEDLEVSPCAEKWRNLDTTSTEKMWTIFEETGIFTGLCRHGTVLLIVDMVRSGEL